MQRLARKDMSINRAADAAVFAGHYDVANGNAASGGSGGGGATALHLSPVAPPPFLTGCFTSAAAAFEPGSKTAATSASRQPMATEAVPTTTAADQQQPFGTSSWAIFSGSTQCAQ
jgi:hypothetical protein